MNLKEFYEQCDRRAQRRKAARAAGLKTAPGELEPLRAFVSTLPRGKKGDELQTPELAARWLGRHGLLESGAVLSEDEHRSVLDLRRGLRSLVRAGQKGDEPDAAELDRLMAATAAGHLALRFDVGIPAGFRPASSSLADALAALAATVVVARLDGTWQRLKICLAPDCHRVFYDSAKSFNTRWCSPQCGDRTRAAAYRRRR